MMEGVIIKHEREGKGKEGTKKGNVKVVDRLAIPRWDGYVSVVCIKLIKSCRLS